MTATTLPPVPPTRVDGGGVRAVPRRRRRSRLLLAGVLLAILGAVGGVLVVGQVARRAAVVAVARPIAFGQTVSTLDLRSVLLPPDTELASVAWDHAGELVGQVAVTELRPGQLLTSDAVSPARPPAPGSAVVGVAVEAGRAPATPLAPRDRVLVIDAGATAGAGTDAVVLRADPGSAGGPMVVDLLIAAGDAPVVARLAAAGRVVLVLVAGRGR
jgi:hypothetical protein